MEQPPEDLVQSALNLRWQEPDEADLTPRRVQMRRLAASMRTVIEGLVLTAASEETIAAAAERLEAISASFGPIREKRFEGFGEVTLGGGDPHALFEHSPFVGLANPLAPPISLRQVDDHVEADVTFGSAYEGPPGCVHGGYIAGAFDEVLGATQTLSGRPGMTGTLTVRYRRPTPLHRPLRFKGVLSRVEGRKIFTEGTLHHRDALCAEAEGVFISIDVEKFVALRAQRDESEQARRGPQLA